MGNRGQVCINGVYLYTHSGGYRLAADVRRALARRIRWDDAEYLTRIIFDSMSEGDHGGELGYGIGTVEHCDLNNPLITINTKNQTVRVGDSFYTFEEFIKVNE